MSENLIISFAEADADSERLFVLGSQLQSELLNLPVESVMRANGEEVPEDARGLDIGAVSDLLVQLEPAVTVLTAVVSAVKAWVARGRSQRSVRLELNGKVLDVADVTEEQQELLIREWITAVQRG